jgi:fatty-acyl-CoA synthase
MQMAVLVVHCRTTDEAERERLVSGIQGDVYKALGIQCTVELVPPNTLPKTSSGKPSRAEARRGFLERAGWTEGVPVGEAAGKG